MVSDQLTTIAMAHVPNPDNQVFQVRVPHETNGQTFWHTVGTLTLLASKGHAQGTLRLNMFPDIVYHAFLKQEEPNNAQCS
jgi:hypothetical protein